MVFDVAPVKEIAVPPTELVISPLNEPVVALTVPPDWFVAVPAVAAFKFAT
jgi:hypothetical protein